MFNIFHKIFNKNKKTSHLNKVQDEILAIAADKLNASPDELKKLWLKEYLAHAEDEFKKDFNNQLSLLKNDYEQRSKAMIIDAFNRLDYKFFRDEFIIKIPCSNQEIKSRLVGLNGRNKKSFERTCGVELIVNEDSDYIMLSSANHIKREIATQVINRLLEIRNIEPNKIENYYKEAVENFDRQVFDIGKNTIEKTLKLNNIDAKIYPYVGRLKYRYSFGQNILEHSIESAYVAEELATRLKLDPQLAKMCAFFHDIGKSVDHETNNDHIQQGIEIANACHLPIEVISSIKNHHSDNSIDYVYDAITKIADKASACKPGARKNDKNEFFKRIEIYEKICMQFKEVQTCYALKSGFILKIILKPNAVKDDELPLLAYRIKQAFEENPETKDYVISLEFIKESVYKLRTDKK